TDAVLDVVRLVADLANLVGDPELEPVRLPREELRDHRLLATVLEDEPEEALRNRGLVLTRRAHLAERLLLEPGLLGLLPQLVRVRLDDRELELALARPLVRLEQVRQVSHEGVELRQAGLHVGVDLHGALQRRKEPPAALA